MQCAGWCVESTISRNYHGTHYGTTSPSIEQAIVVHDSQRSDDVRVQSVKHRLVTHQSYPRQ
jgi:hypothetical protein